MRVPPGPAGQTQAACQGTPGLCCLSGALALGVLRAALHRGNKNNHQISKEHNQESWLAAKENYIRCIEMDLFNGRKETTGQVFELFSYFPGKGCMVSLASRDGKNWESWKWLRYSPQLISCNTLTTSHIWESLNAFSYMLGQKAWKNPWSWAPKQQGIQASCRAQRWTRES